MPVCEAAAGQVFGGRYAALYDLFYGDKGSREEAHALVALLQQHAHGPVRRVLDLACGTGRLAFELARMDLEILGVDRSPEMLTIAQSRSRREGRIRFEQQELEGLDLPNRDWDAAVCMFDSIGYLHEGSARDEALQRSARHLRPGGLLLIEFWHAPAVRKHHDPIRVRAWRTDEGGVLRISKTTIPADEDIATIEYSIYEVLSDSRWRKSAEVHRMEFFSLAGMEQQLRRAGFVVESWLPWPMGATEVVEDTFHVLAIARRV